MNKTAFPPMKKVAMGAWKKLCFVRSPTCVSDIF